MQYMYKISLNDSEALMLSAALKLMMTHCQEKLDSGLDSPYWAHKDSAQDVLNKLDEISKNINYSPLYKAILNKDLNESINEEETHI